MRERSCDVLVVGAGPAGLAAAATAAQGGGSVVVVDENSHAGGQIWRSARHPAGGQTPHPRSLLWQARAQEAGAIFETGTTVFDAPRADQILAVDAAGEALAITAGCIILATGATERFLPFPGWTLPGVLGVGGLQAMVRGGMSVRDKRVLIAGSGPLLLAVAASLRDYGARVVGVVEQASRAAVLRFGASLWRAPGKLLQAGRLFARLRGVPMHHHAWATRAHGADQIEQVTVAVRGRTRRVDVDLLACAFGLVPRTDLARLLGCETSVAADTERVKIDRWQRTTVSQVLCAGEPTGIGGVDLALAEGMVAGHTAVRDTRAATRAAHKRDRALAFARGLERAYTLRDDLRSLATDDTVVCRCEDVTLRAVRTCTSPRQAKIRTRCGMGPCQGRVCGPALRMLKDRFVDADGSAVTDDWPADRVRPPLIPVSVDTLIDARGAWPTASIETPTEPVSTTLPSALPAALSDTPRPQEIPI